MSNLGRKALLLLPEPLVGFTIWAVPIFVLSRDWPPWGQTAGALFFAGFGLGMLRSEYAWTRSFLLGLGAVATIIVRLVIDLSRDPTSHNLFPFEIAIALKMAMPPSVVGLLLGRLLGSRKRLDSARRAFGSVALLTAAAIVVGSLVLVHEQMAQEEADVPAKEEDGLVRMKLVTAVLKNHPMESAALPGTCEVLLTSESRQEAGLNAKEWQGGFGCVSSGAYSFCGSCRGSSFLLRAEADRPENRGPKLRSFCSDNSGVIRFAERGKPLSTHSHQCSDTQRAF